MNSITRLSSFFKFLTKLTDLLIDMKKNFYIES